MERSSNFTPHVKILYTYAPSLETQLTAYQHITNIGTTGENNQAKQ